MDDTPLTASADGDDSAAGLLGLHLALQRADFVLGPRELLLATQLVVRLQQAGQWSEEPERIKPLLRAVYCKSLAEQQRFGDVFDRWLKGRASWRQVATDGGPTVTRIHPLAQATVPSTDKGQRWVIAAVVALVAAGALWQAWQKQAAAPPTPPAVVAPAELPPDNTPPAVATAPGLAASGSAMAPASPDGHAGFEPQQVWQREFRPWVAALLLALPLPLLLLVYAPALALSRRNLDRQRQRSGVKLDVSAWRSEAERVVPVMQPQTAARLDRHVRPGAPATGSARRVLDPARTLSATLRHHGQLSLRWRARRTRPSYLVLIDTRDENDLRGRLFFRWADRLRREGVNVEIWLFNADPRVLYPAHQRRVLDASGGERNAVRFEQVARRAAQETVARLVLVSDGAGFFDKAGALQDWWGQLGWQRWAERVMFTPQDSRDWGDHEVAIERPLGRTDPGFLVLPLEAEALDAYAVQLTKGELPAIVLSGARRYPTLLDKLPQGGLANEPPLPAEVEKLIAQLRLYLGENGLRWLAACAVPPVSRWELTLLIGQELFRDMGATDEEQLRWLMHSNYARLARLPWLRNAAFPDWLALRLLDELSPPVQDRIRQVVRALLDQVPPEQATQADEVLALDCAAPGVGAGAGAGADAIAHETRTPPDETQRRRQWLYLGFMDGLTPRQLAMRAPASWRQWLATPRGQGRGWREWLAFAGDWLRALLARLMWRDGRAEGGVSWWPLALSLGWLVGCGFVLQDLADRPEGDVTPALARWLFEDKRIDAGVASDVPYRQITFSGDGKRFATLDAAGEVQLRGNDARAELLVALAPSDQALIALFLDPKGERLVTVTRTGSVREFRLAASESALPSLQGDLQSTRVEMDPFRRYAAGWTEDGKLRLLGGKTGMAELEVPGDGATLQLAFAASDPSVNAPLFVLRGATRSTLNPFNGEVLAPPQVAQPRGLVRYRWLSPSGDIVVVAYDEGVDILSYRADDGAGRTQRLPNVGAVVLVGFDNQGGVKLLNDNNQLFLWDSVQRKLAPALALALPALAAAASSPAPRTARRLKFAAGASVLLHSAEQDSVDTFAVPMASEIAGPGVAGPLALTATDQTLLLSAKPELLEAHGDDLISTDANHELRLWRRAAALELPPPQGVMLAPRETPSAVAITTDGRWAAAGFSEGVVQVWDVRSGHVRVRINVGGGAVHALVLSVDGTHLVSLGGDRRLRAWDAATGKAVGEPVGEGLAPERLVASRDGTRLLAWSGGNVQLWRVEAAGLRPGPQVQGEDVINAALDERTEQFLTTHFDGKVRVWSGTGGRVTTLNALASAQPTRPTPTVTLPSVLGQPLAAARSALSSLGFRSSVSAQTSPSRALPGTVTQMQPAPGTAVARGSVVHLVVAASACRSGFVERSAYAGDNACVTATMRAQVERDNAEAASRIDPKNRNFGPETCLPGFVWREADRPQRGEKFADKVCVTPAMRQQTAADNNDQGSRQAEGFSVPARKVLASVRPLKSTLAEGLRQVHYVVDRTGRTLLLVRSSSQARLVGLNQPDAELGPAVVHPGITAAAYAARSQLLLTAGSDGALRFWNAETGEESLPSLHHGAPIRQLSVSADGRHAVSGDSGGNLRIWNLAARRGLPYLTTRQAKPQPATPWVNFALDGSGNHLVLAGNHTPAGVAARLPDFQPGELRVVRPYAQFWLAVLGLVVVGGMLVLVQAARNRSRLIDRLVASAGSSHASPAS